MKQRPVAYIITKLELGGAQKVCLSLFEGLSALGTPTFLLSGTQGILVEKVKQKQGVILLGGLRREVSFREFFTELKGFWSLIRQLRALKKLHPTLIVHTHSTKAGIIGRWAGLFAGVTTRIHTIHGFAFHQHQSYVKQLVLKSLEFITSFVTTSYVCVSSVDQAIGASFIPSFKKKCTLIRAAVDDVHFNAVPASLSNTADPFVIGTISCFKPQKNLFDLIKAFAHAQRAHPNMRLELIGDGILREALIGYIRAYHVEDKVVLHGWQNDIMPFMKRWNAFALSSLWEGLPCAIVEARLWKLPIICYDTGGIRDVIIHGKNGLLYTQGDWRGLAEGMLLLATKPSLYEGLRQAEDHLGDFRCSSMVTQHQELYRKID